MDGGRLYEDTYQLIKKIGEGSKGIVYLAKHIRLDRDVVLKVESKDNPLQASGREVDVLKLLKHRYIPNVYDCFCEPDRTVTVMDYIQGESFDKIVGRGETFTQAQVIKWARQLLEALDYLHSPTHGDPPRGFVHSDIKPANIMRLPNGDICLIDFNISLALGDERVTGYTPAYASPEHFGLDFSGSGSTTGRVQVRKCAASTSARIPEKRPPPHRRAFTPPRPKIPTPQGCGGSRRTRDRKRR